MKTLYPVSSSIATDAFTMKTYCFNRDIECSELVEALCELSSAPARRVSGNSYGILKEAAFQYAALRGSSEYVADAKARGIMA